MSQPHPKSVVEWAHGKMRPPPRCLACDQNAGAGTDLGEWTRPEGQVRACRACGDLRAQPFDLGRAVIRR